MAILFTREEGVATVTLNRPEALNALNQETFRELVQAWKDIDSDDTVKVAIITGAGRAFCSGLDVKEAAENVRQGLEPGGGAIRGGDRDYMPSKLRKPLIAAVNGPVAGGGLGLVLFADIAIAAEEAVFVAPFVARGTLAPELLAMLIKKTTPGWAIWMAMSGERIDAQTALRIGLVNEVMPREQLLDRATDMAERIARNNYTAVLAVKEKMQAVLDATYRDAVGSIGAFEKALLEGADFREGFIAFAEKRRPEFGR